MGGSGQPLDLRYKLFMSGSMNEKPSQTKNRHRGNYKDNLKDGQETRRNIDTERVREREREILQKEKTNLRKLQLRKSIMQAINII